MTEFAIETKDLTKKYTLHKEAVKSISLKVPNGSVYVLLGRNGAGKTTTIRMLLGLLQKTSGEIQVLGLNPDRKPVEIKSRVGYVGDNQKMYDWMSIGEVIDFTRSFYPTWDDEFGEKLLEQFELSAKMRLKDLSRGMYGKVALLLALSHRPELLILDDPTSGLDPVVRRQFLQGIIEAIHQQERTVFFSTHIITEVEQVADWVGIIEEGELIVSCPLEALKNSVKKIRLIFEDKVPESVVFSNILKKETSGHELILTVKDFDSETLKLFAKFNPKNTEVLDLGLEEIFISLVGNREIS